MMRVFVTGTGRCGTCTFFHACQYITNFTVSHETAIGRDAVGVWTYPDNHIEVASQLSVVVPLLRKKYPSAKWVHLIREEEACTESLATQCGWEMKLWARLYFLTPPWRVDVLKAARAFYRATNAIITATLPPGSEIVFIRGKDNPDAGMCDQWRRFWGYIQAEGDFEASLAEWSRRYNPAEKRGRDNFVALSSLER